jgi:hypothetical protein
MTRPIPDLLLERYVLNELPAPAAAAIERQIAGDPVLGARIVALERSNSEIRAQYSPARFVRRAPATGVSRRGLVLAGALATAVAGILIVMPRLPASEGVHFKGVTDGVPSLAVYRRTPGGSERLADGDVVHAGDLLRVGYAAAGRNYGVILSIDGRGAVTQHLPPDGDAAAALTQSPVTLLDSAYELDEAPRIERFYFVTGASPFSVAPILASARRVNGVPAALPLPPGLDQVTFSVLKEVRK